MVSRANNNKIRAREISEQISNNSKYYYVRMNYTSLSLCLFCIIIILFSSSSYKQFLFYLTTYMSNELCGVRNASDVRGMERTGFWSLFFCHTLNIKVIEVDCVVQNKQLTSRQHTWNFFFYLSTENLLHWLSLQH